jgi:UDP-glucose 4-epimerase
MKLNILVTGGSGFIGSNLVDALLSSGHNVHIIDDLSTGLKKNENSLATYHHYDLVDCIQDGTHVLNILKTNKINVVYHLAASADIFLSINNPELVYNINLTSSIAFVNLCNKTPSVKSFIFASTSAVYGEPEYLPVDELHPTNPISPYGLSKLGFEQYLSYFKSHSEILFTIFRFPNVYGYRQRPDLEGGVIAIFHDVIQKNENIKMFGDGEQTRDWVEVSDVVSALIKALKYKAKYEIFGLGSGTKTSLNMLFEYFKEAMNYKKTPIYLEERDGDIKHMVMTNSHVQDKLKWAPLIQLESGIKKLIREST